MIMIVVQTWFINTILALWFVKCCVDAWYMIRQHRIEKRQKAIARALAEIAAARKGGAA